LDPDETRPTFRTGYESLAAELQDWVANGGLENSEQEAQAAKSVVDALLELMRANRRPRPEDLDTARRYWEEISPRSLPQYEVFDRLVRSSELLAIDEEQHQRNATDGATAFVAVTFLPSREGTGFSSSIYGFYGDYASDGWVAADYSDLRGVAVAPSEEELHRQSWLGVVVRRLQDQGVVFLSAAEIEDYMAETGAYWALRHGANLSGYPTRALSRMEQLRWRLWPPQLAA
jgi:hypothetical protein